jgi:hypothetical protein
MIPLKVARKKALYCRLKHVLRNQNVGTIRLPRFKSFSLIPRCQASHSFVHSDFTLPSFLRLRCVASAGHYVKVHTEGCSSLFWAYSHPIHFSRRRAGTPTFVLRKESQNISHAFSSSEKLLHRQKPCPITRPSFLTATATVSVIVFGRLLAFFACCFHSPRHPSADI